MESKCIVCNESFVAQRGGRRFCDKPGCRQKFNRREQALKRAADGIADHIQTLMSARKEPHFQNLAERLLRESEKGISTQLDQFAPNRHSVPRAIISATRARMITQGCEYWVFDPAHQQGDLLPIRVVDPSQGDYVVCELLNDKNGTYWNKPKYLMPKTSIFIEITDANARPKAPLHQTPYEDDDPDEDWEDDGNWEDDEDSENSDE